MSFVTSLESSASGSSLTLFTAVAASSPLPLFLSLPDSSASEKMSFVTSLESSASGSSLTLFTAVASDAFASIVFFVAITSSFGISALSLVSIFLDSKLNFSSAFDSSFMLLSPVAVTSSFSFDFGTASAFDLPASSTDKLSLW